MENDPSSLEKLGSFTFIRNKILRAKFYNKWVSRHHELHSCDIPLIHILNYTNNKILVSRMFRIWRKMTNDSILNKKDQPDTKIFIKNDKRYAEFFNDLQELALQNAELATKRNKLNYHIQQIEEFLPSVIEKHKELKNTLNLELLKNEELLKLQADKKQEIKNTIMDYLQKLDIAVAKRNKSQVLQSNTTIASQIPVDSIKESEESYRAKILGLNVRLATYKERAIALRNEICRIMKEIREKQQELALNEIS